jgi:hypothetical protein
MGYSRKYIKFTCITFGFSSFTSLNSLIYTGHFHLLHPEEEDYNV